MHKRAIVIRLVGLGIAVVLVGQAVVETHPWLNGNDASRRLYLLVVSVVVGLLTISTLRIAGRRVGFPAITLAAGAAAGLAAATSWAVVGSVSPTMPRDATGGIALIAVFAALASSIVGYRTKAVRAGCAAGLLAAAVGTAGVFVIAEVIIQDFPGRIPDIVGPVMPAGSTADQILRENRIEIVDGYVALLFLLAASLACLLVVSWVNRRGMTAAAPPG